VPIGKEIETCFICQWKRDLLLSTHVSGNQFSNRRSVGDGQYAVLSVLMAVPQHAQFVSAVAKGRVSKQVSLSHQQVFANTK